MDAVERNLKPHLYSTILFTLVFSFQLFSELLESPNGISKFQIIVPLLGWATCFFSFDWKIQSYFYSLSVFNNYEQNELSVPH